MKRWITLLATVLLPVAMTACGAPQTPLKESETPVPSSSPNQIEKVLLDGPGRLEGMEPVKSLREPFQKGYNAFALRLMQNAALENNSFVSPASVYLALAMTACGAQGRTAQEFLQVLGAENMIALRTDCRDLQSLLSGNPREYFRLANGLWLESSLTPAVQEEFLKTSREYFGARFTVAPFNNSLIAQINQWVADNTAGRITNLLPNSAANDPAILVNTLLFQGEFQSPFVKEATRTGVFRGSQGNVQLPMMCQSLYSPVWYEDEAVTATQLAFKDGRTALLLALPKEEGAAALNRWLDGLDEDRLAAMIKAESGGYVQLHLTLPRFRAAYKEDIVPLLKKMGLKDAFNKDEADFKGMVDTNPSLYIELVLHQTKLEVNESGVLATAATATVMAAAAMPNQIKTMTIDRPFFCALVDVPTGVVLFGGAVYQPEE